MIEVRLTPKCNLRCQFCHMPELNPRILSLKEVMSFIDSVDHSKAQIFTITGGEPTLVPYLPVLIAYIKKSNKDHRVGLQTNGLAFASKEYLLKLLKVGLEKILLSCHGHTEEKFEQVTQIPHSFEKFCVAMENLSKTKLRINISTVLCKWNAQNLKEHFEFLIKKLPNIRSFLIANIFENNNYTKVESYHVRLSDVKGELVEALKYIRSQDKEIILCGIPMCAIPEFEDKYMVGQYEENRPYTKSDVCSSCDYDKYCRGLITAYANLYGTDELVAVSGVAGSYLDTLAQRKEKFLKAKPVFYNNSQI